MQKLVKRIIGGTIALLIVTILSGCYGDNASKIIETKAVMSSGTSVNSESLPDNKENKRTEEKEQSVLKRPDNFTEGVWIKKYPFEFASFKFETPDGIKIICDPFNMNEKVAADIVTESHQDEDHTDTSNITGPFKLYQGPAEFKLFTDKGIKIAGISGKHNKGDKTVTNTIFVFDINGIKIAHFASQGQVPSKDMWAKLNEFNGIDILLIQGTKNPNYTSTKMTVDECCSVIDRLNPKIVIPEHGTANIGEDFAKHYGTKAEYVSFNGFVVTRDYLANIKRHKIMDLDNPRQIND